MSDEPKPRVVKSAEQWEAWLDANHAQMPDGVWIRFYKKGSGRRTVTYSEAVEIALCYGWIDAQGRSEGELSSLQRFLPRRPRSVWSKRNTQHAERLINEGRMKPAGMNEIERAKRDGRWANAYESPSRAAPAEDFLDQLDRNPKAKAFFGTLNRRNTYAIYYRIQTARKPETRERRIRTIIEMLEQEKKLY